MEENYPENKVKGTIIHEVAHVLDMVTEPKPCNAKVPMGTEGGFCGSTGPHCTSVACVMFPTQVNVDRGSTFCQTCKKTFSGKDLGSLKPVKTGKSKKCKHSGNCPQGV